MTDLLRSEIRRALHRRAVWVLIALALVGTGLLGVIAFTDSAGRSVAELSTDGTHPALMRDWWLSGGAEGILTIAALPLMLGAVFGGATVVGAEWRAGTVTTVLGWEPRRARVHAVRMSTVFGLATIIAFLLEVVFLAATLPAVLTHGTTAGVDGAWWLALLGAMARIALCSGIAALLGASLATIGRGSTFALGAIFAWMAVVETTLRGWKPGIARHLIGENLSIVLTWAPLQGEDFSRSALVSAAAVVAYAGVVAAVATAAFVRRDVVGAS